MSDDVPLGVLAAVLFVLICLSAFFSGTETALMALNRYRLRHKANSGNRGARFAESLLQRPDRLITLILFGNNLVNFSAATLASYITLQIFGSGALITAGGTFVFTLVVLIFAEVVPKTLAALDPERLALPASYIYYPLLRLAFPLIWMIGLVSNALLRAAGVDPDAADQHSLTIEELRIAVRESSAMLPQKRQRMLQGILDLDGLTVDDIMVPHREIVGIDLDRPWPEILQVLSTSEYTRLPVFHETLDNMLGMLDMRKLIRAEGITQLDRAKLRSLVEDAYYVPEGTPLHKQLVQFQANRQRAALVVDEYGDIQGFVTLEDILEEIVGDFVTDSAPNHQEVQQESGRDTFLVAASANIRSLNRTMNWELPTDSATTLNGLILEQLETIPPTGTGLKLGDYPIEIVQTSENSVTLVRVCPAEADSDAAVLEQTGS